MARPAGPPTTPSRSATATLVLPGFAETTPPPPPSRTLPEMRVHPAPAPTAAWTAPQRPPPAPESSAPRRARRRVIGLVAVLAFGVVGGGVAAVLEDALTPTRVRALAPRAVVRALHPLGTQQMASRAFETDVTDSSGFGGLGEDVVYHGAGTVSASINFAQLDTRDIRVISADDNPRVRVQLPAVELGSPVFDEARSGVTERHVGILYGLFGLTASEDDLRGEALNDLATQADTSTLRAEARGAAVTQVRNKIVGLGAKAVQVEFASHG